MIFSALLFIAARPVADANLFWTHPFGDSHTVPCTHPLHPNGDPTTVPCVHKHLQHPGGDDTGRRDPFGHRIMLPCTHWITDHPNGDPGPNIPCHHKQHPNGDEIVTGCMHPMAIQRGVGEYGINFYTSNQQIQSEVISDAAKFKNQGIIVGFPRPLAIFFRPPINGNPNDNTDPFWSHYESNNHALVLTDGGALTGSMLTAMQDTARHELGHSILGHSFTHITTPGGPHRMTDANNAALAMSEGWAHFVALFLTGNGNGYAGLDWDNGFQNTGIPFSVKNEFRVGCILWQLLRGTPDKRGNRSGGIAFKELFRVYSPSLQTLRNGPMIPSIDDYLNRLKLNHPEFTARADEARRHNLTPGG